MSKINFCPYVRLGAKNCLQLHFIDGLID